MLLDGHIHILNGAVNKEDLDKKLKAAGVDGGILLSLKPGACDSEGNVYTYVERLENLFSWIGDSELLYPFFWIDPTEKNALEQVELAKSYGVYGFKIICNHFYPGD